MGLRREYVDFVRSIARPIQGKSMLEIGNQIVRSDMATRLRTGKEFWLSHGVARHVSIDRNGLDGADPLDLERPISDYQGEFDVVTDIGVSCYMRDPLTCFENLYSFARPCGSIIHILPAENSRWTCLWHASVEYLSDMCRLFGALPERSETIPGLHGDLIAFAARRYE